MENAIMLRKHKYIKKFSCLLLVAFLLSGCGASSQSDLNVRTQAQKEEQTTYYQLTERELPDGDEGLYECGLLKNEQWLAKEQDICFKNGGIYRLVRLDETVDGVDMIQGYCVQVMEGPYEQWQTYELPALGKWVEGELLTVTAIADVTERGLLLVLSDFMATNHYLALFDWEEGGILLTKVPARLEGASWYLDEEGCLSAINSIGLVMTTFDTMYQVKSEVNLKGVIRGCIPGENILWYGYNEQGLCIKDTPTAEESTTILETEEVQNYLVAQSDNGGLIVTDGLQVWEYTQEVGARHLFYFYDQDYLLDGLIGLTVLQNKQMLFLVEYEGGRYLVTATETDVPIGTGKQEIVIALWQEDIPLQKVVTNYNRKSQKYHVFLVYPEANQDDQTYAQRIRMDVMQGKGPDLLAEGIIDTREGIGQGYLQALNEVIEDMSLYIESAFQSGMVQGTAYGIPYCCYPYYLAVSRNLAEGKTTWTLEEMMERMEQSDAEFLCANLSATDIVMLCGLYDESNNELIDWEAGRSYLTEPPFLELMTFAKEYAAPQDLDYSLLGDRLLVGEVAGEEILLQYPALMQYADACFGGEAAIIGFPRAEGSGIYMMSNKLYMSGTSDKREGVTDFLQYLLSHKGQQQYMKYTDWCIRLSVRRSVLEEAVSVDTKERDIYHESYTGVSWKQTALTARQEEDFWRILETALPADFKADALWSMVSEELDPFFQGAKSARDAADSLHSRVQLYLDEMN